MRRLRILLAVTVAFMTGTAWLLPTVANGATPAVTTLPATDITSTSFTGHCSVTTDTRVQVYLVYGLRGKVLGNPTPIPKLVRIASDPDVVIPVSGLTAGVIYDYQCRIYNSVIRAVRGNTVTVQESVTPTPTTTSPAPTTTTTTTTPPPTQTVTTTATSTSTATVTAAGYVVQTLPESSVTDSGFTANCHVEASARVSSFIKYGPAGTVLSYRAPATTDYVTGVADRSYAVTGLTAGATYEYYCRIYNATIGTVSSTREVVTAGNGSTSTPTTTETVTPPAPIDGSVVAAAGDMCLPSPTSCSATGSLAATLGARFYLPLGDTQYQTGLPSEYATGYAMSTWNNLLADTRPAIGNHELEASLSAEGYCGYFGPLANCPTFYYSFDIDASWHAIALDSNRPTDVAQLDWLQADLAANAGKNVLVYFHHPRKNTDTAGGNNSSVQSLLTPVVNAHADIVLNGHDHIYARFTKIDAAGDTSPTGIRAFTIGTGGTTLRGPILITPDSAERIISKYGVLRLVLGASSFSWEFVTTDGQLSDAGTDSVVP